MGPEQTAPAVVAVIVASGRGAWLDEALCSLATQDYPNLSVLVAEVGTDDLLADRVATLLPDAHFARMPSGTGFVEAVSTAMQMVDGAAHVLICHDDVALAPDAVRLLLEEAYRSNAGLTCPKFVSWDNPDRLLSVGMGVDHLGVVHPLVEPGELDQGQHDAAREVFVAPSGAVLVRSDLWRALGGFGIGTGTPGEDLSLSWRAHLAGARVVVAPQARVRHLEAEAKGLRAGTAGGLTRPSEVAAAQARFSRQGDQQRLRVLWTSYGALGVVLAAPVAVFFAFAESGWALLHPKNGSQVLAPFRSLVESLRRPSALWAARRQTQRVRRVSDLAIWKAQSRGSARLRAIMRPRLERGHELAWAASRGVTVHEALKGSTGDAALAHLAGPEGQGGNGHAVPAHAITIRDPEDLPAPVGDGSQRASRQPAERAASVDGLEGMRRSNWRISAATAVVVAVLLLIGSRHYLTEPLPLVGQLPSLSGGVGSWWHEWWSGVGPGALGSSPFAPPGLLFMGMVGALSFGSANVAVHLLVLAPLALGPLGAYVATRYFGSQRGQLAATVLYAALPLPYNALAQGHWAGLVGYAAAPWVLGALCRLSGQAPYLTLTGRGVWVRLFALGLLVAVTVSLAPATLLLVPVIGVALFVGSLLTGGSKCAARLFWICVMVAVVAFAALLPWSLGAFRSFTAFFAPGSGVAAPLPMASVLRFDTGPYGGGALGWALIGAAAVPLFIGRSWRLAWASRLWVVASVCFVLAWGGSRGWFPVPSLELVLAPAAAALVFAVALGVTAVEVDLSGYRFGWRQFAPAFGAVAVIAATLPFLSWVGGGQWGLPESGAEGAYAFPPAAQNGDYRVLWLGRPGSFPLAAQGSSGGLAFATSLDGLPSAGQLWAPVNAGRATLVADDLSWAENRETTALGRLLAPLAVRYIVVPVGAGAGPPEAQAVNALARQVDLMPVGTDPAYTVFANASWAPLFSVQQPGTSLPTSPGLWAIAAKLQQLDLAPARSLPVGTSSTGSFGVRPSSSPLHVYGAVPSGSWRLEAKGRELSGREAFGWASSWLVPAGTSAFVLSQSGATGQQVADVIMVLVWAVGLCLAFVWVRSKLRAQLTRTTIELGTPGAEVSEIDWSSVWEEQSVV